ncbi:hypothetical protein HPB47_009390 [Ixodes persulcatus]|uniref:Uncharacterized protein n=1 Tax=Ixodes persulcatus TaxID=34615 RepID=A0AC60P224_IXOPE|nr:hypothetical protein HPB47_009390 [Ixodes persulcatus]
MCLLLSVCLACLACIAGHKYSEAMNKAGPPPKPSVNSDEAPFRMHKLNALWEKAQKRLSEAKLKGLYSELKVQDKDELAWKKLRGAGQDKEGLKEAELRHRLKELELKALKEEFQHHQDKIDEYYEILDGTEELSHYEHRLRKLHHFRSELQLKTDLTGGKLDTDPDEVKTLRQRVKQYNHKVGKLHGELEGRILQRRTEL